ncbi:toxin [Rhodohalobacter sp. SW132]|uniref:Tc toxin subunit A-related protein n=1 Tax=Rhodohalobacter sp. SW132 TaxID=2293433 RepID=UPI000E236270|nr:toxin [Rhodohalobacter sp. SW132]REL37868.1 toxin [Rhodohalobacter sp. SW132]
MNYLGHQHQKRKITYKFSNHFHPYIGELTTKLNNGSLDGVLDVDFLESLGKDEDKTLKEIYEPQSKTGSNQSHPYQVEMQELEIDISVDGPYSPYNWELFFHVPFTIAVHLSKNQRFAEAQHWFHYIFDPTNNDTSVPAPKRFWNFLAFRQKSDVDMVDDLLKTLSRPEDSETKERVSKSIEAWRRHPFQPHVIARTRFVAYQLQVIMKYLDNLISWGDSLFRQDTIETLNEATQLYVLAANILGPKPQSIPRRGTTKPQTFASLKNKLDSFGNALVDLENRFPFNQSIPQTKKTDTEGTETLLGIGQTLYFCIPINDQLLGYWDLVADRLFKIRHCMNIEGIVRQLPLFQPPIDPGMLVKAAAGGIDISSLVSGLNQPLSPVRSTLLIQKAQEICGEVRSLGNSLLSVLEKKDGEAISLLRQEQDIRIQELSRDVRYLQWKESESATFSLLKSRESAYQRYRYYKLLLGNKEGDFSDLEQVDLERTTLTEENFDEVYQELVGKYEEDIHLDDYSITDQADSSSPSNQSGATGLGELHLNRNESKELNQHMLDARKFRDTSNSASHIGSTLALIPSMGIDFHYWGIGGRSKVSGGEMLAAVQRLVSNYYSFKASNEDSYGASASKTATYERRANDWMLQANLAAKELTQMGRQIISSLIREQITKKEYDNQLQQIEHAKEVDTFLRDKFTNDELYSWMQGELSRLYHESYKFAFDIAKKAEQTMKHELMRPEANERDFIKFNYWDAGRKGLLAGEALTFDLKRMEMAYHEYNKREYEITKHISIKQLNPMALLQLKSAGVCDVQVPEWLFDMDCPGHYMRRIKNVAVSIPAVAGPYTSINCTLSLQKSTIRKSPIIGDQYARDIENEDSRFIDYYGTIESIVTSSAQNDSGMFDVNLRDERFLPFENAGAESTWRIELPSEVRQFDYNTISDVILHIRYTSRQGGGQMAKEASSNIKTLVGNVNKNGLTRLFSLKHDFPTEWRKFSNSEDRTFKATITKDHFPYITQIGDINVDDDSGSLPYQLIEIKQDNLDLNTIPLNNIGINLAIDDSDKGLEITDDEAGTLKGIDGDLFFLVYYSIDV